MGETAQRLLITQRSQVRILPPLPAKTALGRLSSGSFRDCFVGQARMGWLIAEAAAPRDRS
jgi:hypothetical protein